MSGPETVVVINPRAGQGRAARLWQKLAATLPAASGIEVIQEETVAASRARLAERLRAGCRRVFSFGGDGTANLVVNVLLAEGRGHEVALGIVPAGTASDFARHAGIPAQAQQALQRALASRATRPIDAIEIRVDGQTAPSYSLNITSAGLSGHVDTWVHKSHGGNYLLATLRGLWTYRALNCQVWVDGQSFFSGPFFVLAMANGRYFGKAMKVAPMAVDDDGLLDVVLVREVPTWQLPLRLPQFYLGYHVKTRHVLQTRGREIRLEPTPGYPPYDLDGETLPAGPATVRVLPAALRLLG